MLTSHFKNKRVIRCGSTSDFSDEFYVQCTGFSKFECIKKETEILWAQIGTSLYDCFITAKYNCRNKGEKNPPLYRRDWFKTGYYGKHAKVIHESSGFPSGDHYNFTIDGITFNDIWTPKWEERFKVFHSYIRATAPSKPQFRRGGCSKG